MKTKELNLFIHGKLVYGLALLTVTVSLLFSTPAQSFQFRHGDIRGNLDTTISYGASWRVQSRDSDLIGIAKRNSESRRIA